MSHPDPISILDIANEARLYLDCDLDGSGNAIAIVHMGSGARASLSLDRDDVRRLHEWSGAVLTRAGLLAPRTPPSADMDLAQVVAELQDIYRSAVTEPETGNAWRDGYVAGYVRAMRTALTITGGTPPETPTTRVLAERADRRTT